MEAQIQSLTEENLPQAADALASAFFNDPLIRHLAPSDEHRKRWMNPLMESNLRLTLPEGISKVLLDETRQAHGAIGVLPPATYPPPLGRVLKFEWDIFRKPRPWIPSPRTLIRGFRYAQAWEKMHFTRPHYYVYILGVRVERHGQGFGRQLLQSIFDLADHTGHPVYLETQTESNLKFYGHLGFEVTEKTQVPGTGPPTWGLLRRGPFRTN